jgi:photosystem II stability/assembly factor-like uncharacterized protein
MNFFLSTTGMGLMIAAQNTDKQWSVENLLDGQEITCLARDPNRAGEVYAGTRYQGVLFSRDYGRTWSPAGLSEHTVKAISVSHIDPGVVYAGTKPALIFVSRDHGQHWDELPSFRKIFSRRFWFSPAEAPYSAYVQGIALSPTDENVILVGIEAGAVVRSMDGGKTWEDHRRGALRDCHSITFHATDGAWAYEAGGTGAGAAISRDRGCTWNQTKAGLDRHYGWACAADPAHPDIWYVSASPGPFNAHGDRDAQAFIFRSAGGAPWQKLSGGLSQPLDHMPYALLTDPDAPGHLYAGLSNGDVWFSPDYGDTWEQLPFNLSSIQRTMIML